MTYFKAIQPNGTDFYSGKVRWAPADEPAVPGSVVRHPWAAAVGLRADSYLSASTVATDCTGMRWPCRLLEVEPVDAHGQVIEPETTQPERLPNKRAAIRWRIVRELPAHEALGPQGEQIAALIKRASELSPHESKELMREFHRDIIYLRALEEANRVCSLAARGVIRLELHSITIALPLWAPWKDIQGAITALLIRDLIGPGGFTQEHYDALTGHWRRIIGPIHPGDERVDC